MTQMLRKQIYITRRQQEQLKRLANARGVSQSEVIRQSIDHELFYAATQSRFGDRSVLEEFLRFGLSRRAAGDPTGRAWTRDELYDERLIYHGRAEA